VDPVPEKVIRSNIKTLGISRTELEGWLIKRHKKKSR
jgi:hypothetical protein